MGLATWAAEQKKWAEVSSDDMFEKDSPDTFIKCLAF